MKDTQPSNGGRTGCQGNKVEENKFQK